MLSTIELMIAREELMSTAPSSDYRKEVWGRWVGTSIQSRIIFFSVVVLLLMAAGLYLRPDNPVSNYWIEKNISPDFVILSLVAGAFSLFPNWYIFRRIEFLIFSMTPYGVVLYLLGEQILVSSTAPMIHFVMAVLLFFSLLILYYLSAEIDSYKEALEFAKDKNKELAKELETKADEIERND